MPHIIVCTYTCTYTCARWPALLVAPFIAPNGTATGFASRVHCSGRLIVDRKPDGVCTPLRSVGRRLAHFTRDALCALSLVYHYAEAATRTAPNKRLRCFSIFRFSKKSRGIFHVLLELGRVCFVREIIQTLKISNFLGLCSVCMFTTGLNKNYIASENVGTSFFFLI